MSGPAGPRQLPAWGLPARAFPLAKDYVRSDANTLPAGEPDLSASCEASLRRVGVSDPNAQRIVPDPDADGQAARDERRELVFVAEDAIWAEADAFAHDPADDWYRQPPGDEPRELTFVDEDTFWAEF